MNNVSVKIPADLRLRKYSSNQVVFAYPDGSSLVEFATDKHSRLIRILPAGEHRHRIDVQLLDAVSDLEQIAQREFENSSTQPENVAPEKKVWTEREIWHLRRLFVEGGRDMMVIETNFVAVKDKKYRIDFIVSPEYYESGLWVFELITETISDPNA